MKRPSGLIISRTPTRISFFGGGTDYPTWFNENPGAVLATSIDKYIYITVKWLPPYFTNKYFISYSQLERPNRLDEIDHPSVREVLRFLSFEKESSGVNITYTGDVPASSGMGSSSAFTVGLLNALCTLKRQPALKPFLASSAIYVEQELIKENVGIQDQTITAFGGFNLIDFSNSPLTITPLNGHILEPSCMLFFTKLTRNASKIAEEQIRKTSDNRQILSEMYKLVHQSVELLNASNILGFGQLLGYNWSLKKKLSSKITNPFIDEHYSLGIKAGAIGGKLLGAGGGGCLLFIVEPERQDNVRRALSDLIEIPVKFESIGSTIIYDSSPT